LKKYMQNLKMDNKNIDDSFRIVPLGELCLKLRGVSYSKDEATNTFKVGYVPILRANNISDDELNFEDLVYVPKGRVAEKQYLQKGDVVIAMSSGSKKVVGKGALLKNDWNGSFGAFCGVLRPDKTKVDPDYFGYYFGSATYRNYISDVSAGTNINNLRNEHFENILFPLPPLSVQKAIAAQLDNLLHAVKPNKTRLSRAKKLAVKFRQAILEAAISGKLTETWRENCGEYEWEKTSLLDVALKITDGDHNPPKRVLSGIPYLTAKNIKKNSIVFEGSSFINESDYEKVSKRYKPQKNDVLITCVGTLGETAIVGEDTNFTIDRNIAVVRPNDKILSQYLEIFLNSPSVQQILKTSSGSSAQPHIYLTDLKLTRIELPNLNEQAEIIKIVSKYLNDTRQIESHIEKAEAKVAKLTQSILSKTYKPEL